MLIKYNEKLSYRVITDINDLKKFIESNSVNLSDFDTSSVFLSEEFIMAWVEHYKTYIHDLAFIIYNKDNTVIGISPLYIKKSGHLELRFLCTGENEEDEISSEYLDFIINEEHKDDILLMFVDYLIRNSNKWKNLVVNSYTPHSFINKNLIPYLEKNKYSIFTENIGSRYYLDLPDSNEDFYKSKKGSFYNGLKRKHRKLLKSEDIKYEIISDSTHLDKYFNALKDLHNQRWKRSNVRGVFESDVFFNFHKSISHKLLTKNYLFLFIMSDNEDVISILYGYIFKNVLHFYQSGYTTPKYQNLSIGAVSHIMAIEYAISKNLSTYDFMLGSSDSYKNQYKCRKENIYQSEIYKPGIYGKLKLLIRKIHDPG